MPDGRIDLSHSLHYNLTRLTRNIESKTALMRTTNWQLQEAKAHLSELVRSVQENGPQRITVHGKPAAVILSCDDYARLARKKPSFVNLMRQSPLMGVDLQLERDQSLTREHTL